jgi:hypothetical protein
MKIPFRAMTITNNGEYKTIHTWGNVTTVDLENEPNSNWPA